MKLCQSCGMPLNGQVLGTNANGSKNEDYYYRSSKYYLKTKI